MYLRLRKVRNDFDVVVANYNITAFPVALAMWRSGKGYYYIQAYEPEFYDELDTIKARMSSLLARLSYKLPLIQIVNAPMYRAYHEISTGHVVEPGVDLTVYQSRQQLWKDDEITIGCIGRKSKWKGTLEIIQAVERVRNSTGRDLKLKVAFEFPDTINMADYNFIELCAPHGDERLAEFYQSCDVFIATGLIQDGAFHYPCIESMASGCVVISNYAPANLENSVYLSKVDADKISSALIDVLKMSPSQRNTLVNSAVSDVGRYRWNIISSKIIEVFKVNGGNR
jgi:glycosyltransferase involved in cell wall biosynthesis